MHSSRSPTQPSTPEEHGQTGSLRRYTQELNEMESQGFPTGSLECDGSCTLSRHASPELLREADTHGAWPNESRDDPGQPGIFSTATDDEGHGMSTFGLENRENIAAEEQELTMTFALGPGTVSTHTETIYPGSRNEARQRFTLLVPFKGHHNRLAHSLRGAAEQIIV
jgi:hypothetical protein